MACEPLGGPTSTAHSTFISCPSLGSFYSLCCFPTSVPVGPQHSSHFASRDASLTLWPQGECGLRSAPTVRESRVADGCSLMENPEFRPKCLSFKPHQARAVPNSSRLFPKAPGTFRCILQMSGAGHHEAGGFECQLHTHGPCRQQLKGQDERQGRAISQSSRGPCRLWTWCCLPAVHPMRTTWGPPPFHRPVRPLTLWRNGCKSECC